MKIFRLLIALMVMGCSVSPAPPEFPKNWRPINELKEKPVAIELNRQHIYLVTRLDTTVKGLVTRWGEEAKIPVVYDHTHDFTLFKSVLNIRNTDLNIALKELSDWYTNQNIVFYIRDNVIVVHKRNDDGHNQFNYIDTNESK